ncbi:hypothetical protein Leryth_023151 [Lithospermum erythrorhizon]|nr:hypothetical protein Leryth_023151 [Lithospermum erythrorhizon]
MLVSRMHSSKATSRPGAFPALLVHFIQHIRVIVKTGSKEEKQREVTSSTQIAVDASALLSNRLVVQGRGRGVYNHNSARRSRGFHPNYENHHQHSYVGVGDKSLTDAQFNQLVQLLDKASIPSDNTTTSNAYMAPSQKELVVFGRQSNELYIVDISGFANELAAHNFSNSSSSSDVLSLVNKDVDSSANMFSSCSNVVNIDLNISYSTSKYINNTGTFSFSVVTSLTWHLFDELISKFYQDY